jgi:uroporphyrinogen decarboxylase
MNSRERVLTALNYREPDKIPIDFSGHRSSGISAIAYAKLKRELGIDSGDIYVYDMIQQLALVEEPVLDRFQVDVVDMDRAFMQEDKHWKEWTLPDGTPCKIPAGVKMEKRGNDHYLLADDGLETGVQREGMLFFDQVHYPLMSRDFETFDFSQINDHFRHSMWSIVPGPGSEFPEGAEGLREKAARVKAMREQTERAVIGSFGGNLFEAPQNLFRTDQYLLYTMLYPEAAKRLSAQLAEQYCADLEIWLREIGPFVDVILFGDDFGSNQGPLIDPQAYRDLYKPYHMKMWGMVKELAPHLKIQMHSCGSIEPFLEDFIEAGLDAVNPVQVSAKDMDIEMLSWKYSRRMTFWGGGCDTQHVLAAGTPEEVRRHVRKQVEIMKKSKGGFVFQQVHNIMGNVPPENIIAMFDTVIKYRSL